MRRLCLVLSILVLGLPILGYGAGLLDQAQQMLSPGSQGGPDNATIVSGRLIPYASHWRLSAADSSR